MQALAYPDPPKVNHYFGAADESRLVEAFATSISGVGSRSVC